MTNLAFALVVVPAAIWLGAIVFQWHTQLRYLTDVPIAYVYAALLIDKRVFSRVSPEDQAVVREVTKIETATEDGHSFALTI